MHHHETMANHPPRHGHDHDRGYVPSRTLAAVEEVTKKIQKSMKEIEGKKPTVQVQEKDPEPEEEEVPKCHLHRKPNKACRFCKKYTAAQEAKIIKEEAKKNEEMKKLLEPSEEEKAAKGGKSDAVLVVPNKSQFPKELKEQILQCKSFTNSFNEVHQIKNVLKEECESCDLDEKFEDRDFKIASYGPSKFIMCIYKLLNMRITEAELFTFLHNSHWIVRCAGFVFVRLGVHQDRYWELLSDALMDEERFTPFRFRDPIESMTVGEYVERLLQLDKYGNINLPRLSAAWRTKFSERLTMYGQFRDRYAMNLEILDRYETKGVAVEACGVDGEWVKGRTVGEVKSIGRAKSCIQVLVKLEDGKQQPFSLGMVISDTEDEGFIWEYDEDDLTQSRGKSNKELLDECRERRKESQVTDAKVQGMKFFHAHGQTFYAGGLGGGGKKRNKKYGDEESSSEDDQQAKRRKEASEIEQKERERQQFEIIQKYCAGSAAVKASSASTANPDVDTPDLVRLG